MPEESLPQVGRLALERGFITADQLAEAIREEERRRLAGSTVGLGELLVELKMLTRWQLETLSAGPATSQKAPPRATRQPIEGYELLKKLGEGAMGATYLARQTSIDRQVALKVLRRNLSRDAEYVERFRREARLAGNLRHANVVSMHEVGESGGFHYLAMEYVEGKSLHDLIPAQGGMDEKEALGLIVQVARALEAAHAHRIVHRDVKPDNILVGSDGVVKLCDFGLSRDSTAQTRLTQSGVTMGTPHYISPEQARGDRDADIRSDIYSLGATLYRLVTGLPPFDGPNPLVVLSKHLTEQLPWPQDINPKVSERCCRVIAKMMAKEREERYRTPTELVADLELLIAGRDPVGAALAAGRSSLGLSGTVPVDRAALERPRARPARRPQPPDEEEPREPGLETGALAPVGGRLLLPVWVLTSGGAAVAIAGLVLGLLLGGGGGGPAEPKKEPGEPIPVGRPDREDTGPGLPAAPEGAQIVFAEADAYVKGGIYTRERCGAEAEVRLACGSPNEDCEGYIRFDLSGLKNEVAQATLVLYVLGTDKLEPDAMEVDVPAEGAWDEKTLCWEKRPRSGQTAARSAPEPGPAEIDVTAAAKEAQKTEDGKLTLHLAMRRVGPEAALRFASKENRRTDRHPRLVVLTGPKLAPRPKPPGPGTEPPTAVAEKGTGLLADYFAGRNFEEFIVRRTDAAVDFEWGEGVPAAGVPSDGFSVRWVGSVLPPRTGRYTLQTSTDDGVRLWVDGRLLIDRWAGGQETETSAGVQLLSGQKHAIRMEYFDKNGTAVAKLSWSGPGIDGTQVIAKGYLFPPEKEPPKPPTREELAEQAWGRDIAGRAAPKTAEEGKAALAAIDTWFKAHGATAFAKGKLGEAEKLRFAARLALGPPVYDQWPFDAAEARRRQKETSEMLRLPVELAVDLGRGVKLELVLIPAGEFEMGSELEAKDVNKLGPGGKMEWWEREHPKHRVRLTRPYYLGKYEVTQEQWGRVTGKNPSSYTGDKRLPVETVNWDDCQEFLKKLGELIPHPLPLPGGEGAKVKAEFRLPTEAQWEHACRAGTDTPFWFGEKTPADQANYDADWEWDGKKGKSRLKPLPVGSFAANRWGLCDMAGNVSEWCEDGWGWYSKEKQTDPKGMEGSSVRVLRGGDWYHVPGTCRSAARANSPATRSSSTSGLRVLMAVPEPGAK